MSIYITGARLKEGSETPNGVVHFNYFDHVQRPFFVFEHTDDSEQSYPTFILDGADFLAALHAFGLVRINPPRSNLGVTETAIPDGYGHGGNVHVELADPDNTTDPDPLVTIQSNYDADNPNGEAVQVRLSGILESLRALGLFGHAGSVLQQSPQAEERF